jgi:hypothetical protein
MYTLKRTTGYHQPTLLELWRLYDDWDGDQVRISEEEAEDTG